MAVDTYTAREMPVVPELWTLTVQFWIAYAPGVAADVPFASTPVTVGVTADVDVTLESREFMAVPSPNRTPVSATLADDASVSVSLSTLELVPMVTSVVVTNAVTLMLTVYWSSPHNDTLSGITIASAYVPAFTSTSWRTLLAVYASSAAVRAACIVRNGVV